MAVTRAAARFDPAKMRSVRIAAGLNRRQLADRCPNISVHAVRAYEEGRNVPDVNRALELASALGVGITAFTT